MRSQIVLALLGAALLPTVRAADGDSIESVMRAVYETISGPAGQRDWGRFRSLFVTGAKLVSMRTTADGTMPVVMTVEDYITRAGANFEKSPFYESEAARRVETFGSIAQVFSTYESRRAPNDRPFARGINSFQLLKDGGSWKVLTILWEAEREGNPLPQKYLGSAATPHIANGGTGNVASPRPSGD
jgi:hypothetical protein